MRRGEEKRGEVRRGEERKEKVRRGEERRGPEPETKNWNQRMLPLA